jgi:glycosyltransferase involved in cell wall biosynthesis
MQGVVRGREQTPGRAVGEALQAIKQLEALGHRQPLIVAYHPVARLNPYQAMLYSRAWQNGAAAVPLFHIEELDGLSALRDHARIVLHLHWLNLILKDVQGDAEAAGAIRAFVERLDRFRADRGGLIWSIHNVLPHETRMPAREAELRQAVAHRADVVHVLAARTRDATSGLFTYAAEKEFHVPHPSYAGAYPDYVTGDEARYQLGLPPSVTVFAAIGAIKPYKGLVELLDAFDELGSRNGRASRLVIAGLPGDEAAVTDLLERCLLHPFVSLHAHAIPAEEIQLFFRAADIAVMPYGGALNSGALMLALTFGVPVIVANDMGLSDVVTPEMSRTFEPGSRRSLVSALQRSEELTTHDARSAALAIAQQHNPAALSDRFFEGIRERISARPTAEALRVD